MTSGWADLDLRSFPQHFPTEPNIQSWVINKIITEYFVITGDDHIKYCKYTCFGTKHPLKNLNTLPQLLRNTCWPVCPSAPLS